MTADEAQCPVCGSKKYILCVWEGWESDDPPPAFHARRIELAAMQTIGNVSAEAFDRAVEESNLV
jgi:hypothetical protein